MPHNDGTASHTPTIATDLADGKRQKHSRIESEKAKAIADADTSARGYGWLDDGCRVKTAAVSRIGNCTWAAVQKCLLIWSTCRPSSHSF